MFFSSFLPAQNPFPLCQPSLHFLDARAGLPTDTVHTLLLEPNGDLWAGTVDGAARFSGGAWEPFRLPEASTSNYIRAILRDRSGGLWFGTQDGGLWRLKAGVWSHFAAGRELPSNRINCLLETFGPGGEPVLWAGTGGGIARLEQGRWTTIGRAEGLPGTFVWKLRETRGPDGRPILWAATQEGLGAFREGRWRQVGPGEGFLGTSVNDVLEARDAQGRSLVWVSCWGRGTACFDGVRWTHFDAPAAFPSRYPTALCAVPGPGGVPTVWAGTFDTGAAYHAGGRWQGLGGVRTLTGVYSLQAIPSGKPTLLLGTRGSGVAFLDLGGWRTLDERMGLPTREATSFAETEGAFWVGTAKGLARFRTGAPATVERMGPGDLPNFINRLHVTRDPGGKETLWAGTLQGLLRRVDGTWKPVRDLPLLEGAVHAFLETVSNDGARTLWVGTTRGLACLEQGRWRTCLPAPGSPAPDVPTLCATRGADGEPVIWAGTRGQGVACRRGGTWTWLGAAEALPSPSVYGLAAARSRNGRQWLWAATPGGGIARLDAERPGARWETYRSRNTQGFLSDLVSGLVFDLEGRLYATTSRGVLRITLAEPDGIPVPSRVENFTTADGLPSTTLASNFTYRDRDGRIWIGTPKGAAVLDPALETRVPAPAVPHLLRASADDREKAPDAPLEFGHRERRIVLEFALPAFHRQADTRYRTQLLGLETQPTPWQPQGRRELTGLPPGSYVLQVWGQDYAGRVTEPLAVSLRVRPAPWASPWAYVLYAAALAGAALGLLRWRTRHLQAQNRALQAAVQERTRLITAQSLDLAATNRDLSALNVQHEHLITELQGALGEVRTLQGFIPICSYCKKVRNDTGSWDQLETYISERSGASFSHGVCPDCRTEVAEEFKQTRT